MDTVPVSPVSPSAAGSPVPPGPPGGSGKGGEIRGLTSLRGLAAFYVVLLHFSKTAQEHSAVEIPTLAPSGHLGVDLFFVLSGFIMAYTYLAEFERDGIRAFPNFLGRRLARIEPLNVAVLLALALSTLAGVLIVGHGPFPYLGLDNLGFDLIGNLLFLQGFGIVRNMNGVSWSVSCECAAYLIFPVLLALIFHRRRLVFGLSVAVSIAGLAALASLPPVFGTDSVVHGTAWGFVRCFTEFTLGLAAYRFYATGRYQKILASNILVVALSAAIIVIMLRWLGDVFAVLLFPPLILAVACNRGWPGRLLAAPLPYFMGVISYSIYMIHDSLRHLALGLLRALHPALLDERAALCFAALGSLGVIGPAWLTYRFVERPGRRLGRYLLEGPKRGRRGRVAGREQAERLKA